LFRLLVFAVVVVVLGAVFAPSFRVALAWVLAFLSLLMLGDLLRGSFAQQRRSSSPPRA
jgi:hypothetical protein